MSKPLKESGLQIMIPKLVWKYEDGMGGLGSPTLTMLIQFTGCVTKARLRGWEQYRWDSSALASVHSVQP